MQDAALQARKASLPEKSQTWMSFSHRSTVPDLAWSPDNHWPSPKMIAAWSYAAHRKARSVTDYPTTYLRGHMQQNIWPGRPMECVW